MLLNSNDHRVYIPLIGLIGVIVLVLVLGGDCFLAFAELLTVCLLQAVGSLPLVAVCVFGVAEYTVNARYQSLGIEVEGTIVERVEPREQDLSIQSLLRDALTNNNNNSSLQQDSLPRVYSVVIEYETSGRQENDFQKCRYRKQLTIRNDPSFLVDSFIRLRVLPLHPKSARWASQIAFSNENYVWVGLGIFLAVWFALLFWWYLPFEAMQARFAFDGCRNMDHSVAFCLFWGIYIMGGMASVATNLLVSTTILNHLMRMLLEGNCEELGLAVDNNNNNTEHTATDHDDNKSNHQKEETEHGAVALPKSYKDPSGLVGMLVV